ncbi:MAG: histidine phosphatase family protein [Polyangiaceae bacterium]
MARTRLILVRHGQTADNARRVFQGQTGSGLDELGRQQASLVGERLGRSAQKFVALYSSDLQRAHETASAIAANVGLAVVTDIRLREVNVGAWSGHSYDEIARQFPEEWAAWKAGQDVPRGGGESYQDLAVRIRAVLFEIASVHSEQTTIVVSHGAAIRSFCAMVLGLPAQGIHSFSGLTNTGIATVELDEQGFRLMGWNDVAHLDHLPHP